MDLVDYQVKNVSRKKLKTMMVIKAAMKDEANKLKEEVAANGLDHQQVVRLVNEVCSLQLQSNQLLRDVFELQTELDVLQEKLYSENSKSKDRLDINRNEKNVKSSSLLSQLDSDRIQSIINYIIDKEEIFVRELSTEFNINAKDAVQIINELLTSQQLEGYLISNKKFVYFPKTKLDQFCGIIRQYCVQNYINVYMNSFIELLSLKTRKRK